MYLKMLKEVTRAHLPSLITSTTQLMLGVLEVKGDATDASVSEREIPALARFNAPQSLAPSPHIPGNKKFPRRRNKRRLSRESNNFGTIHSHTFCLLIDGL